MIKNPYIRQIFIGLLYLIMTVLSVFIFPIAYIFRNKVRKNTFLWLFLNDTTKQNENDIDWGIYGRFSRNFIGAFRQCVIRNNSWNFKAYVINKGVKGDAKDIKVIKTSDDRPMMLRNYTIHGYQWCEYKVNDMKMFRASFTKTILGILINVQIGASGSRYLFKTRLTIKNNSK